MWLLDFLQGFNDLFRSRYVRYLEGEITRLRQENAGLSTTLMSSKGITVVPSPDLQDLTARGRKLTQRDPIAGPRTMKPVVRGATHAKWRQQVEAEDRKKALAHEAEILARKEEQDKAKETVNAP